MKLERLAARDAQAIHRIDAALESLTAKHGIGGDALDAFRAARTRDRAITAMHRNEAIAGFLEALDGTDAIETDLHELTVAALKEMAEKRGISGTSDMRKAELIAAIEAEGS